MNKKYLFKTIILVFYIISPHFVRTQDIITEVSKEFNKCGGRINFDLECITIRAKANPYLMPHIYSDIANILFYKHDKIMALYYAKKAAETMRLNNMDISSIYQIFSDANEHQYYLNKVITQFKIDNNSEYLELSHLYSGFDYKKSDYYYSIYDPYKDQYIIFDYFSINNLLPIKGKENKNCELVEYLYNIALKRLGDLQLEKNQWSDQQGYNYSLKKQKKDLREMIAYRSFCLGKKGEYSKAIKELNRSNEILPFTSEELDGHSDESISSWAYLCIFSMFWNSDPYMADYHRKNTLPDFLKHNFNLFNEIYNSEKTNK